MHCRTRLSAAKCAYCQLSNCVSSWDTSSSRTPWMASCFLDAPFVITWYNCNMCVRACIYRYNCNRYNEDEAKKARDAQEVSYYLYQGGYVFIGKCLFVCLLVGRIVQKRFDQFLHKSLER